MDTRIVSRRPTEANASLATCSESSELSGRTPLLELQALITSLRVKAEVVVSADESEGASNSLPMVPVFDPVFRRPHDDLSMNRDSSRRDEKIIKLLRERGALRILGAVASPSLADAISQLYHTHVNFTEAIDYVLGEEALARHRGEALCGLRILLHGRAGTGKTDFCLSLASLLAVPNEVISLSSAQAAAFLAGSEEYWSNTKPGIVWQQLIQGTYANPLFVLDEIDKTVTRWGDPLGALFQLLEPRTAEVFCDKSVPWLPIDARHCHWVATANDADQLHPAIRSRFTEIEVCSPNEEALYSLLQRLYANLLSEFDLHERFPAQLSERQASALLGGSVRDAKRVLRAALAQALREENEELMLKPPTQVVIGRQRIGF